MEDRFGLDAGQGVRDDGQRQPQENCEGARDASCGFHGVDPFVVFW
jgi:hypothetical protein